MMSSSSPTRSAQFHPYASKKVKKGDLEHDIVLQRGTTIIFGRHRHNQSNSTSTSLESTIPKTLSHLLAHPTNDATTVHLSRHASHASRVHAAVELVETNVMRVVVIGQNGLRLRVVGQKKGVRLLPGQRYDLSLNGGDEAAELDFFGCRATVRTEEKTFKAMPVEEEEGPEERRERLFSSSPMSPIPAQRLELASSLPPSSPPMMTMDLDEELSELEEEEEAAPVESHSHEEVTVNAVAESSHSRQSSPLSPPSEAHFDLASPSTPPHAASPLPEDHITEKLIKAEQLESLAPSHPHPHPHGHGHGHAHTKPVSRASSPARPVPSDVDLPAIIASTVVFSGSSKLSLPDLVKHMLEVCTTVLCETREYADVSCDT